MKPGKFELFKDRSRGYRVRLVARNGRKLWVSESYTRHASALRAMKAFADAADGAALVDKTKK